jgi:hypothetical protein
MRLYFILFLIGFALAGQLAAQRACLSAAYQESELRNNPSLAGEVSRIESFIQRQIQDRASANTSARVQQMVLKISVVVHILYHLPGENITDQQVFSQIAMLNKCFRRAHADSANTPSVFKPLAADCEIEFQLAISDAGRKSTTGIIHKYTPVLEWEANDLMKSSAQTGDDAWDSQSYLNIWVCSMKRIAGYSSLPGSIATKDGVVIDYTVFGTNNTSGYEMGKTAVHEVGHWLGLKHIWGDAYCGDDLVDDTPKQGNYTAGCPSGVRVSCGNAPSGDMYMNYMDYTNDACINLFTEGQKARMRTLFVAGGPRYAILSSVGLKLPLISESPLPEEPPTWLRPNIYPNPATDELILDIAYDVRWIGNAITILNVNGQVVMTLSITTKVQKINISRLKPGLYFLSAKKEDGTVIKQKFIKM